VRVLEKRPDSQPHRGASLQVARYVESKPDHLAHAENYCAAMSTPARTGTVSGRVVSRRQVEEMLG
jgi:hypothetical protein